MNGIAKFFITIINMFRCIMSRRRFSKGIPKKFADKILAVFPNDTKLRQALADNNICGVNSILFSYLFPPSHYQLDPKDPDFAAKKARTDRVLAERKALYDEFRRITS